MRNPLAERAASDPEDRELVCQAEGGHREALEQLITRHQAWIYNIVLRMVYLPQDAEDATQEILVKLMTTLSTFVGKSSFRTWLYRIVVNHVLNMKRGRADMAGWTFTRYGDGLDAARPIWICRIRGPCRPMCSCWWTKPESVAPRACCCASIASSA